MTHPPSLMTGFGVPNEASQVISRELLILINLKFILKCFLQQWGSFTHIVYIDFT